VPTISNRLPVRIIETEEGPALEYSEDANLGNLLSVLDQLGFEFHVQLVRKDGKPPRVAPTAPPAVKYKALPKPAAAARTSQAKKGKKAPSPILPDSQLGKVMKAFEGQEKMTKSEISQATGVSVRNLGSVLTIAIKRGALRRLGPALYAKA